MIKKIKEYTRDVVEINDEEVKSFFRWYEFLKWWNKRKSARLTLLCQSHDGQRDVKK